MFRPRSRRGSTDPFSVLGVPPDADAGMIMDARRRLAKRLHPDTGGSVESMQELNAAVDAALALAAGSATGSDVPRASPPGRESRPTPHGGLRQDHPSFTVEVLPAMAFEGAQLVGAALGEILDDEPPYLIEVRMVRPAAAWCRLEFVPDAGSTTVSITTARLPGHPTPDVFEVRDAWIDGLNQLDWTDPGPTLRPS